MRPLAIISKKEVKETFGYHITREPWLSFPKNTGKRPLARSFHKSTGKRDIWLSFHKNNGIDLGLSIYKNTGKET